MEQLRQSLYRKIDALLVEVLSHQRHPQDAHLQLEAFVFQPQQSVDSLDTRTDTERRVLDCININQWKALNDTNSSGALPSPVSVSSRRTSALRKSQCEEAAAGKSYTTNSTSNGSGDDSCRRKVTGGLRLRPNVISQADIRTPPQSPQQQTARQLETEDRQFPKRRKLNEDGPAKLEQSTADRLIEGIWEQIHRPGSLALGKDLKEVISSIAQKISDDPSRVGTNINFEDASKCCQQVTSGSRTTRALEVIVQAHWVDTYEERISVLRESRPDLKTGEVKRLVITEACRFLEWSEKELRNKMAIWKGYREIKNAAGWAALVFAGPGIYRFCKYRLGFDQEAMLKFTNLRTRIEVAADTIQPQWRQLLSLVGAPTQLHWRGHPHDWVVSKKKTHDPVPLHVTYKHSDPDFSFEHLEESIIDTETWGMTEPHKDPKRRHPQSQDDPAEDQFQNHKCSQCSLPQSLSAEMNECECFPEFFGPNSNGNNKSSRSAKPAVQVFRTDNGRNNGLLACCAFPRGSVVGPFVGLITKGLSNKDVMSARVCGGEPYQIWQGRQGNYTRFINHSCKPNCRFQTFSWLGVQHVLVVSKGVVAGKEFTVDYSDRYWLHLDKVCLCGEAKCRYTADSRSIPGSGS